VAQDRTSVSTDGVTWSDIGTNAAGQSLAESGGKVYSLLGSVVTQIAANNTLTTVVNDFGASISTVRYLNGLYLAPGSGVMARSADGLVWTLGFLAPGLTSFTGNDIAFGSGLYVYVTAYGSTVYTSPDLVTWTPRTLPAPGSAGPASVAFGGGTFVILSTASSYAVTFSSPDGIAWTAGTDNHALVDSQYSGFAAATLLYDGTHFVAARGDGAVLVSADGRAWTGYNPMLPQPLRTISPGAAGAIWGVGDSGLWATHAAY
jgi:hypothetical protein